MKNNTKRIAIALRDFAVPVPRAGSIEAHSGYGHPAAEGQAIHVRVQQQRVKHDPSYETEVPLCHEFTTQEYRFKIDGRMDGIFRQDTPRIEEIKSCFNIGDLARRLSSNPMIHPYCLQLLTYGYIYWLNHRVIPKLTFHLVSSRSGASKDIELLLDLHSYEGWLGTRLDELVSEARKAEKCVARRRRIASCFSFPFENPRPGQIELINTIAQGMDEGSRMLIQAPTGLGKTAGVLYPVLREALSRGQRVVYVTPKNSQHMVADDAVMRFRESGVKLRSLTITAKGKICLKNEPLCNPDYCEFARDYYTKVHKNKILDILAKKKNLRARTFRSIGEEFQVCPFELQFDGAQEADIVICDYNYVFAPRSALRRMTMIGIDQVGKPSLVVDEAHNVPARAMDYYSPSLSSIELESMRSAIRAVHSHYRNEAEELLDGCIQTIVSCRSEGQSKPMKINPPVTLFLQHDSKLRALLSRYIDSGVEIQPRDIILRLCFYWSEFTEVLEYVGDPARQEFFTTFHPHSTGGTIKITCCDASAMLKHCYDEYEQVVGFSATLKPFDYYARLSGLELENIRKAELPSPFSKARRKIVIIPQISTKYTARERNYSKIADAILKIAALQPGNYFAFFPSFEFMDSVLVPFRPPEGFTVLKQERNMRADRVEAILEHLREQLVPTIVFAVQGGMFSEGVDFPGGMVIGAFVIGPPLPHFDLEREQMREYYQRQYGAGFDYAYTIPAMAKTVQAAGRVIRSETDRGLIVLMDSRFVQSRYSRSMPVDWFESSAIELVSAGILKEVADFWERNLA